MSYQKSLGYAIQSYLVERLSFDDVQKFFSFPRDLDQATGELITLLFHAVYHFHMDSDIREKDEEYSKSTWYSIMKMANCLINEDNACLKRELNAFFNG